MQNHTQNCLKDWSEEDLRACHLDNWNQVDLQNFLPSIQSRLLKEKYNTSFNQTKKQIVLFEFNCLTFKNKIDINLI